VTKSTSHFLLLGLVSALLMWLGDVVIDVFVFHEGTLLQQLLFPASRELWMRSNLLVFFVLFLLYLMVFIRRRDTLQAALQSALAQADAERAKVEAIIAALGDGLSIQDTDFNILYQNEVHKQLTGGDFEGQPCFRAYDRRDCVCPDCPVVASYEDGQIHKLVKKVDMVPGVSHIEIIASPLRSAKGDIIAGIELVRDISQQVQVNTAVEHQAQALSTVNRELEAFSYTVSHDVRKPLTIIYTAAQTLQEQIDTGQEDLGYLARTICDACRRMEELIDALQMLAHVSQGELQHNDVDLSASAAEILAELQAMEPDRSVTWSISPALLVAGDGRLLRLVLENLLGNAWKYSRDRVPARIGFGEVETERGRTLYVRDNGAGFDMARVDQLFQPFVRLHTGAEFPGTGIGLATVQRIVQRHGGQVWCEARVGQGATFYFTLPRHSVPER
jgi:signal transduction histidine kinase